MGPVLHKLFIMEFIFDDDIADGHGHGTVGGGFDGYPFSGSRCCLGSFRIKNNKFGTPFESCLELGCFDLAV